MLIRSSFPAIWNSDQIEQLKQLHADGLTNKQIAIEMGCFGHCHDGGRSAVSGKISRLHLPPITKVPKIKPKAEKAPKKPGKISSLSAPSRNPAMSLGEKHRLARVEAAGAEPCADAPEVLDEKPLGTGIKLADLKGEVGGDGASCRWPRGDPRKPDFEFCPNTALTGLPYCANHCMRAYPPR